MAGWARICQWIDHQDDDTHYHYPRSVVIPTAKQYQSVKIRYLVADKNSNRVPQLTVRSCLTMKKLQRKISMKADSLRKMSLGGEQQSSSFDEITLTETGSNGSNGRDDAGRAAGGRRTSEARRERGGGEERGGRGLQRAQTISHHPRQEKTRVSLTKGIQNIQMFRCKRKSPWSQCVAFATETSIRYL